MLDRMFQNRISSNASKTDPKEAFKELLDCEEAERYTLKINSKYSSLMSHVFWCAISRCYWSLDFVDLSQDIFYIMQERGN